MAGTIAYMAPEQIEAHPRPASDQYSLGIVVYEWLCGERPFHGTLTEIAIKHSVTPPPSLIEQLPSLPPAVEQVILTALAKKPEERFASIRSFVTALEQASTTKPVLSPTTSAPEQPTKSSPPYAEKSALPNNPAPGQSMKSSPPYIEGSSLPQNQAELPVPLNPLDRQPSVVAVLPHIDGAEVLRRVRGGDVPPNWRIFYTSQNKVTASHIMSIFKGLCTAIFAADLTLIIDLPIYILSGQVKLGEVGFVVTQNLSPLLSGNDTGWVIWVGFVILFFLLFLWVEIREWVSDHDRVLVLRPKGIIDGRMSAQQATRVINYKDIVSMHGKRGAEVEMSLRKQKEGRESLSLHLGLFESSEILPLRINDAYEDFKAGGYVVTDGDFDAILSDVGSNKIQVIKVVRELTGLGLKEAKAVVDEAPRLIKEAVSKEEAQRIADKMKEVGATVIIK
jgi:hypothetical protein